MTETKARYTVCTIITKDVELLNQSDTVRHMGYTHESIYRAGIDAIMSGNKSEQ